MIPLIRLLKPKIEKYIPQTVRISVKSLKSYEVEPVYSSCLDFTCSPLRGILVKFKVQGDLENVVFEVFHPKLRFFKMSALSRKWDFSSSPAKTVKLEKLTRGDIITMELFPVEEWEAKQL